MREFRRSSPLLACASLLIFLFSPVARAQDAVGRDREARALFEAGREAFSAAEYARALDYFQRSFDLSGRSELLYNIAQSADRAREDEIAVAAYERFLREVPESQYRGMAESRLAFLRDRLAAEAEVQPPPEPARVEGPVEIVAPAAPVAAENGDDDAGGRVGPWLLVGGGAAVAATGVVLTALGSRARSNVEDAPAGTPWSEVSRDYERAAPLGTSGLVCLGVGVVAAGVGITLVAASDGDEDGDGVAVTVGPTGIALQGTF